jgi:TrmH family RNA methyltransferase
MPAIQSAQNETYKKLLGLTTAKGLKAEGLFLLSGEKLMREYLRAPKTGIAHEIVGPRMKPVSRGEIVELAAPLFAEIDALGTHFNILVLEQPKIEKIDDIDAHKPRGVELAVPVGDPGNLGALIRSAEAFGVPRVILTQEAAHPFLPKSVKASAGSVLRMPLARGPALKDFPENCIALDDEGTPIADFKWPKNALLIVGEEGAGLGAKKFRQRVSIPTQGVESLNAVVAASIALYKIKEKR